MCSEKNTCDSLVSGQFPSKFRHQNIARSHLYWYLSTDDLCFCKITAWIVGSFIIISMHAFVKFATFSTSSSDTNIFSIYKGLGGSDGWIITHEFSKRKSVLVLVDHSNQHHKRWVIALIFFFQLCLLEFAHPYGFYINHHHVSSSPTRGILNGCYRSVIITDVCVNFTL